MRCLYCKLVIPIKLLGLFNKQNIDPIKSSLCPGLLVAFVSAVPQRRLRAGRQNVPDLSYLAPAASDVKTSYLAPAAPPAAPAAAPRQKQTIFKN